MLIIYSIILFFLSVYSYSLIDPNLTFFQTHWWEIFRAKMVYFGYYQRDLSWFVYLSLIILLFIFHLYFLKKHKGFNPLKIALLISGVLLISYPLLSHDFFNYLFDARIVTYYNHNPYLKKALDFPSDPWLRFMHWTHRTYPYGPVFLLISLVPSFLSLGKFILSFFFFKLTFAGFYILAVYYLAKLDKKAAVFFATNPLLLIEGLVNSHNDLIAVALAIIGIYYLLVSKLQFNARLLLLLSTGIKFITLPIVFLSKQKLIWNKIIFAFTGGILIYLSLKSEIQPWYFLNLFIFLPIIRSINRLDIFFLGLLLSYYPYIRLGGWDTVEKINLKNSIIIIFFVANVIQLIFLKFRYLHNVKKNN